MGPSGIEVKALVKNPSLVGGGWKGAIVVALGPLRWSEHHHKVVVVGVDSVQQGHNLPCSPLWSFVDPTRKFAKIK